MRSRRAFTLIELIVAVGIFTMLGLMLVMTLRSAIGAWQKGEQSRELYESARVITRQLTRDLEAVFPQKMAAEQRGDIRFWSDMDSNQRQRLQFVRALGADERNVATWSAGSGTPSQGFDGMYNRHDDMKKRLRAHGGLAEVAYVMDPNPTSFTLYRGIRSPVGFRGSLLDSGNIDSPQEVQSQCHPLSTDVLYLRFYFWGFQTTSWDLGGQAYAQWDSTRGRNPGFTPYYSPESANDWGDDVWPFKVRVVMTLRGEGRRGVFAYLKQKVGAKDNRIHLSNTSSFPDPDGGQAYALIDSEWISYSAKEDGMLLVANRGVRGTVAAAHVPRSSRVITTFAPADKEKKKPLRKTVTIQTKVYAGQTFVIVRDLPAVGEFGR